MGLIWNPVALPIWVPRLLAWFTLEAISRFREGGTQWFILRKTIFLRFQMGSNIFQGGPFIIQGGLKAKHFEVIAIELVIFQGVSPSVSAHVSLIEI